jgi:signal transduction histidine kinase
MRRLHYKLSAGMLAIVLILGTAFYGIERYSSRLYFEELTQRLNSSLAMYIANSEPLISGDRVNDEALKTLASRAMVINPTAEIYLLDESGAILGHALPPEEIVADRVDLEPILDLLSGSRTLPITGENPRDPAARKVFSAFPVSDALDDSQLAGYLYVVLGGSQYEAIATEVSGSYQQRIIVASLFLLIAAAFTAGALLFAYLTRRLRRLTREVSEVTARHFEAASSITAADSISDEIDQLRNACRYMLSTIQQQLARMQEDDRLRRELITNISHDLRTPLASMQGYIETLIIKDETLDAQARSQYLEIARRHATHLGRLINDLFELTMLDANRVNPEFEEFALTELIYDVVQEFELKAREADVALEVDPPEQEVFVYADISLIQRVLENLVGNALRHTPPGGKVTIAARSSSTGVGISVSDTGNGIPADAIPHIFDRFFQADHAHRDASGSAGLGLAIAKRILELHGSEIRVTSERQIGTRFDFDLASQTRAA